MVVFSALHKQQLVRSIFFTIVSLFLYFKTSGLFVVLLGGSIIVNFFLGKWVFKTEKESGKKWIIAFAAIFNLFFLAFFKYAYFFTDSYNQLFQTKYEIVNWFAQMGNGFFGTGFFETKILLPAGVSFFTFQSISYVVDIKRKEIEPVKNIFDLPLLIILLRSRLIVYIQHALYTYINEYIHNRIFISLHSSLL
jgi:D-alanyl-lipoteichoic acid acyltransferase DltB (MBOAT superfamily)